MAKKKAKTETVNIMPNFTPEQAKKFNEASERKGHLEYLCFMMLRRLNDKCQLKQLIQAGIAKGITDADDLVEFFGDSNDDESGCCEAGSYTIPGLLDAWQDATNEMMGAMTPA